jgi:hypothetical protein
MGTLNSARNACTYQDGREVRFTNAVPAEVPDEYDWNFDVLNGMGATCLAFRSDERAMSVQTASGRVEQSNAGFDLLMTCPSGAKFRMTAEEAFTCLFDLPGSAWSSSGDFFSVSVLGGGEGVGEFVNCDSGM